MRFKPDRDIAIGILKVFDGGAPFWQTCSKLTDVANTFQIINRSTIFTLGNWEYFLINVQKREN